MKTLQLALLFSCLVMSQVKFVDSFSDKFILGNVEFHRGIVSFRLLK